MPPMPSSNQTQVMTLTQDKPQNRLEGTGPYGATLNKGLLSRPLTHTQKPVSVISITKSEIEIKGNVEDSVVAKTVQNEGLIEFDIEGKDVTTIDPPDNVTIVTDPGLAPNAMPNTAVTQSVVGCDVKTKGIKFRRQRA